ncbi:hypothetical protein MPH_13276, partial [Macrophomina phaseolina MS6]
VAVLQLLAFLLSRSTLPTYYTYHISESRCWGPSRCYPEQFPVDRDDALSPLTSSATHGNSPFRHTTSPSCPSRLPQLRLAFRTVVGSSDRGLSPWHSFRRVSLPPSEIILLETHSNHVEMHSDRAFLA